MGFTVRKSVLIVFAMITTSLSPTDLVDSSWADIVNTVTWHRGSVAPRVSDNKSVASAIAEVDEKEIRVSRAFVQKLQSSQLNSDRQKEVMLFLLAHEVAHWEIQPANAPDAEYQADFLASIYVRAIDPNYHTAGPAFFSFAGDELKKDKRHGSPAEREQRLATRKKEIDALAAEFSLIVDGLSSGNAAVAAKAEGQLKAFEDKARFPSIGKITGFGLAVAAAKHRVWLTSADRKALGVQVSVYLPAHPQSRRGSKGGKEVPGDKARFIAARKAYSQHIKNHPHDLRAKLNFLALIAYEGEEEASKLYAELKSQSLADRQWLNNMGVAAYVLAENGLLPKGAAIDWFEKAERATTVGDATEKDLEAKVIFNLARAYEQAGRQADAATAMNRYRQHSSADLCWRNADFKCSGEKPQPKTPNNLAGFRLQMSPAEVSAVAKTQHKACIAGKLLPIGENVNQVDYLCGSANDKFRFVFIDGKAVMVQYYGLNPTRVSVDTGSSKGGVTAQLRRIDVVERLGDPESGKADQLQYPSIGLYILLDSGHKVYSIAMGDHRRMDKKEIGR